MRWKFQTYLLFSSLVTLCGLLHLQNWGLFESQTSGTLKCKSCNFSQEPTFCWKIRPLINLLKAFYKIILKNPNFKQFIIDIISNRILMQPCSKKMQSNNFTISSLTENFHTTWSNKTLKFLVKCSLFFALQKLEGTTIWKIQQKPVLDFSGQNLNFTLAFDFEIYIYCELQFHL